MPNRYTQHNQAERARLEALVRRLSVEQLSIPMEAGWTPSAVLAHLAFWDQRALTLLRHWQEHGIGPSGLDTDIVNEAMRLHCLAIPPHSAAELALSCAVAIDKAIDELAPEMLAAVETNGQTVHLDRGAHRQTHIADIEAAVSAAYRALYPIRVSENRRYTIDRHGAPFLIHGDTAWSLFTGVTKEEAVLYLTDRASKGFNSIIVNLIEHKFNGPATREGLLPFANPNDFTTTNDAYFDHCEWVTAQAADHGIQIFLAPIYLGYPNQEDDEGWYHEALACGVEKCRAYGRYVGKRFGKFDNIVWLMGGDRNPGAALPHVNAVAEGIKEFAGDRHLFSAHTLEESSPLVEYASGGWLNLNATYTYTIIHRQLHRDYRRQPAMPTYLIESSYEGMHNASAEQIRRQAYWAILCGGCGHFLGNYPMWGYYEGWQAALDSPASRDMTYWKALFDSRPWHTLIPDLEHQVVIAGLGEFRGLDYCAAARSSDGRLMMAYMPTARAITVDLSQLQCAMTTAWWFDPRTGAATPAGQWHRDMVRFREFMPPSLGDWVLVVEDAGLRLPPPGK